jgi:ABC-type spermidine/putrescine transport system permease subunit I
MANQSIRDENPALTAVVTGTVNGGDTINYTLATTASQFSNVGQYPIAVTLGIILTIVLFQLMVFKRNSKEVLL